MVIALGTIAVPDISLVGQIVVFIVLVMGISRVRNKLPGHETLRRSAFLFSSIWVIYMLYSFFSGNFIGLPLKIRIILNVHILPGLTTVIPGILFISNQWRWKVKKNMRAAFLAWSGALVSGMAFYLRFYSGI